MTLTQTSEAQLRAALQWSARQMPLEPPATFDAPIHRHRPLMAAAGAIGAAAAIVIGTLWLHSGTTIDTVTTQVVDTGVSDVTNATSVDTTPPSEPAPSIAATTATTTYVLQPYDWVGSIADQFGITMDELVALNGWPDGLRHVLVAGDTILVPSG